MKSMINDYVEHISRDRVFSLRNPRSRTRRIMGEMSRLGLPLSEAWVQSMQNEIQPVYLPHNEPYLGDSELLAFDQIIPLAMAVNSSLAARTFDGNLTGLQVAATEIIPQGVSIALSIRELIRQAYLYSAAILIRPLIDRAGTICWLRDHETALVSWRNGWPRKDQPPFETRNRSLRRTLFGCFINTFIVIPRAPRTICSNAKVF